MNVVSNLKSAEEIVIKEKTVLKSLPPINFLLSLLIVFHHGFTRNVGYIGSYNPFEYGVITGIERYLYNISECAVPVFFLLSAYLFYRTFDGTVENYIQKIKRRFWSLFVPYIIFNTIGYVKNMTFGGRNGGGIDYMYSLWNADTMPLWFVRELIFFSLLAPIYYQVKNRLWLSVLVSIMLIILATLNIVEYRSFLYWTPVYLVGASLNKNRVVKIFETLEKKITKYLLFLFLIIYCLGAWFLPNGVEKENVIYSMEFVMFRLSTPLAFTVIIYSIVECKVRVRKWMHYSFFVYCMHAPIIKLLSMIYCKIVPSFYGGELVQFFVVIALTYTVCVVLAISLERYMSPVWKIMNGNRL